MQLAVPTIHLNKLFSYCELCLVDNVPELSRRSKPYIPVGQIPYSVNNSPTKVKIRRLKQKVGQEHIIPFSLWHEVILEQDNPITYDELLTYIREHAHLYHGSWPPGGTSKFPTVPLSTMIGIFNNDIMYKEPYQTIRKNWFYRKEILDTKHNISGIIRETFQGTSYKVRNLLIVSFTRLLYGYAGTPTAYSYNITTKVTNALRRANLSE